MIEVFIERWTAADGSTSYRWSIWSDGRRVEMGAHVYSDADACEAEALGFCHRSLGQAPDKVTRL